MKKVTVFSLARFNNAYHVNFHSNVLAMIEQYGEDSIGVSTSLLNQYKAEIGKETDAVKRTTAMEETQKIRELDTARDQSFRYVRNVLVNLQYSPDKELAALFDSVRVKILNMYPASIATESDNEESAHIRGFVLDIRENFKTKIEKMGLTAALDALEKANNDLQELYVTRAANHAANGTEVTVKCRAAVDEDYSRIVSRIEYTAQLTELTDESSVMIRKTCETFIDALNALITRTWQSVNMGKNGKGNETEPEVGSEDGSEDGEQGTH